jgi:hypothetical protein
MAAVFRTFGRLDYADGPSGHVGLHNPVDLELFWISKFHTIGPNARVLATDRLTT